MATGRRPDYNLSAMDAASGERSGNLGAAWINEDGSINIKLNPGTSLTPNLKVRLWPTDKPLQAGETVPMASERATRGRVPSEPPAPNGRKTKPSTGFDDMDDDIPF